MRIVLVVGPSGAGKDSLLRGARRYFGANGKLGFVRRYITRPPDASEDNYYIDPTGFLLLERADFFISTWRAHGNHYGIPRHTLEGERQHELLLISISRSAIADFERRYDLVSTIQVTVQEDILYERLVGRGRENGPEIEKRLGRARNPVVARDLIVFDNSGDFISSKANFIDLLQRLGSKNVEKV